MKLGNLPLAGDRSRSKSKIWTLCPRYSALVFDNVTRAAVAAVAAVPADSDRAQSDQQHRRLDELVMAELASPRTPSTGEASGDTIFSAARARRRADRGAQRREYALTPSNLVIADAAVRSPSPA